MPSRQSAKDCYVAKYPDDAPFVAGAEYGHGPANAPGIDSALADFDSGLQQLTSKDPSVLLKSLQTNISAALKG